MSRYDFSSDHKVTVTGYGPNRREAVADSHEIAQRYFGTDRNLQMASSNPGLVDEIDRVRDGAGHTVNLAVTFSVTVTWEEMRSH